MSAAINLGHIDDAALRFLLGNRCFTKAICTGLSAAGITDTYYDLSCVPAAGVPA